MYGPTWFLDNAARETGLLSDLQKVFNGNLEITQDVLTLAYYLFLDNRSYSHIEKWQREVKTGIPLFPMIQKNAGWIMAGTIMPA